MDACSDPSGPTLAPEQEPDEQSQHSDRHSAGGSQQPSDGDGVGAACRIVAVAEQADVMGQCSDDAIAGIDDGKAERGGIDSKTGQGPRDAAVGRDHERSRWMGELIAVSIVDRSEAQRLRESIESVRVAP